MTGTNDDSMPPTRAALLAYPIVTFRTTCTQKGGGSRGQSSPEYRREDLGRVEKGDSVDARDGESADDDQDETQPVGCDGDQRTGETTCTSTAAVRSRVLRIVQKPTQNEAPGEERLPSDSVHHEHVEDDGRKLDRNRVQEFRVERSGNELNRHRQAVVDQRHRRPASVASRDKQTRRGANQDSRVMRSQPLRTGCLRICANVLPTDGMVIMSCSGFSGSFVLFPDASAARTAVASPAAGRLTADHAIGRRSAPLRPLMSSHRGDSIVRSQVTMYTSVSVPITRKIIRQYGSRYPRAASRHEPTAQQSASGDRADAEGRT